MGKSKRELEKNKSKLGRNMWELFKSEERGVRNFPDDENERMVKNRMVVVLCTLKKLYSVLSITSTKLQHAPPRLSFIVI